jgi:hypothetical protein
MQREASELVDSARSQAIGEISLGLNLNELRGLPRLPRRVLLLSAGVAVAAVLVAERLLPALETALHTIPSQGPTTPHTNWAESIYANRPITRTRPIHDIPRERAVAFEDSPGGVAAA